ncbi:hypothetical protein BGZ83_009672 [Gryganskiella cystojenkinii]|nr:hypothetical protein BGZ83_009672 [Gryganskiella cystojenkinii]
MSSIRNFQEPSHNQTLQTFADSDNDTQDKPSSYPILPSATCLHPDTGRIRPSTQEFTQVTHLPCTVKALRIPEVVFMIQENLPRSTLLVSLRVARQWYRTGQALVWRKAHWDNTLVTEPQRPVSGAVVSKESLILENIYRIRSLDCMFHSQGRTSNIDSSVLLRALIYGDGSPLTQSSSMAQEINIPDRMDESPSFQPSLSRMTQNLQHNDISLNHGVIVPARANRLQQLTLKGHFDLLSSIPLPLASSCETADHAQVTEDESTKPLTLTTTSFVAFKIPTLTRLEIHPLISSAVDLHWILDSALGLEELVIHSHGSFLDSRLPPFTEDQEVSALHQNGSSQRIHGSLRSLKIQYLKISRDQLQQIADRCPNMVEFQSLCTPGAIWKQRPQLVTATLPSTPAPSQQQNSNPNSDHMSIVCGLAKSWPRLERLHVGQQQGGFHLDSIRETLCSFPRLGSIGIPAWDCTKVTMDTIKATQIELMSSSLSSSRTTESTAPARFLTSLCIMNVCSSEKVSQALHDFLCWTPHLKEFNAYNTTLYVDQMNPSISPPQQQQQQETPAAFQTPLGVDSTEVLFDRQNRAEVPSSTPPTAPHQNEAVVAAQTEVPRRWACKSLERLVVRFARLPWRNLSEPPKRSHETFAFLENLENLQHLCIKEGLMLESGREYESLAKLTKLEEVVFTTCYPIPIKSSDMGAWIPSRSTTTTAASSSALKRVVIRRQKANLTMDRELTEWFKQSRPGVEFGFELTDCCEEEYSFH